MKLLLAELLNLDGIEVTEYHNFDHEIIEVVGYFERRTNRGMVEGINNRLKVIKRNGFGFKVFENFAKRALLFWHFPDSLA